MDFQFAPHNLRLKFQFTRTVQLPKFRSLPIAFLCPPNRHIYLSIPPATVEFRNCTIEEKPQSLLRLRTTDHSIVGPLGRGPLLARCENVPRQGEGTYIAQLICGNTPEVARVFSTRPFTMPPIKESESISLKFSMEEAWGSAIYGFAHVSFAPRRKNRSRGQSLIVPCSLAL